MRTLRRILLRFAACAVVGVVVSVGVAWGWWNFLNSNLGRYCRLSDGPEFGHVVERGGGLWEVFYGRKHGIWFCEADGALSKQMAEKGRLQINQQTLPSGEEELSIRLVKESWPSLPTTALDKAKWPGLVRVAGVAVGLPFPCVGSQRIRGVGRRSPDIESGRLKFGGWQFHYQPLPLGLALNTLFYGSITACLWFGIPAARRILRKHRGLCPLCGYHLSGLTPDAATGAVVCPECGPRKEA